MRTAERRTAAKDEPERASVNSGDRSEGFDDVEILFDECRAGQAKMGLNLEKLPQGRSPLKHELRVPIAELSRETPLDAHSRIDRHLR